MAGWETLLSVQAEAAATLTGLVFVAVSINLGRVLDVAGLPGRAAESILQLLEIFVMASAALIPGQSAKHAGTEFLCVGAIFWMAQAAGQIRYLRIRAGHPWSWFVYRAILGQSAAAPFCVAGIEMLRGDCGGFYWLIPGFGFSFLAAVVSAWVLLVEIHR
jgi:modulator of FtsH protease